MTDASAEEILAFVGSQFDSVEQITTTAHAADAFPPQENDERLKTQAVAIDGDGYRGMEPMARYLACDGQPLQITVAQPRTSDCKGN
jgi:hypothetical protein